MVDKLRFQTHQVPLSQTTHYNVNWSTDPSPGTISTYTREPVYSAQKTSTESHGWPRSKGQSPDVGGSFATSKITDFQCDQSIYTSGRRYGTRYIGPWLPMNPDAFIDSALSAVRPDMLGMIGKGATAVSKCIPTSPAVDTTTALGELVTGLPQLPAKALVKSQFKSSREYGSEYLNVQFGWLPLVSDIKKLGKAVQESEKIIEQFYRDSGKRVRRRYEFPPEVTTVESGESRTYGWVPSNTAQSTYVYKGQGRVKTVTTSTVRTWFSGCFTYYAPAGVGYPANVKKFSAEARRLYGIELTPEVVWNLTPFSWLTDWYANTGDILKNVSRFSQDGLVMPYGYLMQQREVTRELTCFGGGIDAPNNSGFSKMYVRAVSKARVRANPFGFGVDNSSLTGRQLAILGALGLSQQRR